MAGAVPSLSFQKVGNWGGGAFLSWYKSRQMLVGGAKDFSRISPNFPEKFFCETFAYKVSPTKII